MKYGALLAIVDHAKPDWSNRDLATNRVEESDVSTFLLPITQLELEAHLLLTRATPQDRLVRGVGGRAGGEIRRADHLAFDGWFVPAVFIDVSIVKRIASGRVGDEPDVGLCASAAGNGSGGVDGGQLGNLDL